MARTNYDTTIYDTPVYTGGGATTQSRSPSLSPPGTGNLVTQPPLGTPHPPSGVNSGTAVPRDPLHPPAEYVPPAAPPTTTPPPVVTPPKPTTKPPLDIHDPASVDAYLAYMATINNNVRDKLAYWRERILSGDLGTDEAYIFQKMQDINASGGGEGDTSTSGGGGFDLSGVNFGNLFDDPATVGLMNFLQTRLGQLTTPINDPNAEILSQAIKDAMARLNRIQDTPLTPPAAPAPLRDLGPQFEALTKAIQDSTNSTTGPTAQYRTLLDNLVKELSQPAFSTDQLAQLKTAAVDTLNHEHQQALDNKARAMGMQGIPPSSGVAQEGLKNVDQQYQTLKAQALQAQNVQEIAMVNERRQQLMQAASSSLTAAQQQAQQEQAAFEAQMNLLLNQRTQDISVRGQDLTAAQQAAQLALEARGQDISTTTGSISLAQALEQLSRGQRTEQNANLNSALQLLGIPVQLSSDRLSQALQVLGLGSGSTSPSQLLAALDAITKTQAAGNATNSTNTSNQWKAIADYIANLGKK